MMFNFENNGSGMNECLFRIQQMKTGFSFSAHAPDLPISVDVSENKPTTVRAIFNLCLNILDSSAVQQEIVPF